MFANLQVRRTLWWRSGPGSCSFEPGCSCQRRTASARAGGPGEPHRPSCNDGPSVKRIRVSTEKHRAEAYYEIL